MKCAACVPTRRLPSHLLHHTRAHCYRERKQPRSRGSVEQQEPVPNQLLLPHREFRREVEGASGANFLVWLPFGETPGVQDFCRLTTCTHSLVQVHDQSRCSHIIFHTCCFLRIFMIILKVNRVRMNIPSPCLAGELRGVDGNIHKAVVCNWLRGIAGLSTSTPCAHRPLTTEPRKPRVLSFSWLNGSTVYRTQS